MSKARLVVTAVTVEGRPISEVARSYGVARSRVYALLARYYASDADSILRNLHSAARRGSPSKPGRHGGDYPVHPPVQPCAC